MAKRFQITLAGEAISFWAEPELTILRASLRGGGGLLSSCRSGTCRACRCRLLEGEISYLIEWPGLSAEEKAEGWILPCVAQPRSNLLLLRPAED
ncbi:2Fe-2S iron-sulfur cluster-binding protein [Roseateles oligotrophus]|uniref:2Fe-2S iron-sulfur cluster-binding protein n=1 Tax=Roseateles oligotrophus TaxID=1769250 RepID=A0ABT2YB99_9BURK|nr:2Fe-2S iron-sulfur cluster-binding protein [Roseateles oligotrophus]MCV2367350.1 2Fe-2S iron-sulfur cluster-binding protein [Roseateles oligotrophus]